MTSQGESRATRLDPAVVESTFAACHDDDGEIVIDGSIAAARFNEDRLADHAESIRAMLLELPDQFRASGGGGWSFLNACEDRHGDLWTGMQSTVAMLFALGIGIGMVDLLLPREMWASLPGGMPYYVIKDT